MYPSLILASKSPRRRELLTRMGVEFTVDAPDITEDVVGMPRDIVLSLSVRKAHAVADHIDSRFVLAADTMVALDYVVLGKPTDVRDADRMLHLLSGRTHEVYTGVCLSDAQTGRDYVHVEVTKVTFHVLTDEQIARYIATGDPMDKAGAYGIQSEGARFVQAFDGSYENVMGLPVQAVHEILMKLSV